MWLNGPIRPPGALTASATPTAARPARARTARAITGRPAGTRRFIPEAKHAGDHAVVKVRLGLAQGLERRVAIAVGLHPQQLAVAIARMPGKGVAHLVATAAGDGKRPEHKHTVVEHANLLNLYLPAGPILFHVGEVAADPVVAPVLAAFEQR